MQLFHRIDDQFAIVRVGRGVYKQAELYHRAGALFAKAAGGFVQVRPKFGNHWGTTSPTVNVVDMPEPVRTEYRL